MKCSRCGNEVGGAGQYTQRYGFICFSCSNSLDIRICSVCGQKFPLGEMKEHQGEFFCNDDYRARMAQIESYKPKPQPKGPPLRGGAGTRIRRRRTTKPKEPYDPIVRELRSSNKPETAAPENAEPEKQISPEEENAEISELLKGINKERSSGAKKENEEVSETLNELRKARKEKKNEKKE